MELSSHAKQQIEARKHGKIINRHGKTLYRVSNVVSEEHVIQAVEKHKGALDSLGADEVRVVVRSFKVVIQAPDGSNGDLVVACVNPTDGVIKTVMLQRRSQARIKSKQVPYLV